MGSEYDFTKIAQPTLDPATSFEDMPATIERACCPHKTCGNVTLELRFAAVRTSPDGPETVRYAYRRGNGWNGYDDGDEYRGADTLAELIEQINDPACWPTVGGL